MWGITVKSSLLLWQHSPIADITKNPVLCGHQRGLPLVLLWKMWVYAISSPRWGLDGWFLQDLQMSQSCSSSSSWWPEMHFSHPFLGVIFTSHPTLPRTSSQGKLTPPMSSAGFWHAGRRQKCQPKELLHHWDKILREEKQKKEKCFFTQLGLRAFFRQTGL